MFSGDGDSFDSCVLAGLGEVAEFFEWSFVEEGEAVGLRKVDVASGDGDWDFVHGLII